MESKSMMEETKCYICGANSFGETDPMSVYTRFECKACGKFRIGPDENKDKPNKDFLASFLYYSKISSPIADEIYFCFLDSKDKFEEIQKKYPYDRLVTNQEAETWYPKTFNEKINRILLGFSELSKYDGNPIERTHEQYCSAFFVKRYNSDDSETTEEERNNQIKLIENYLLENNFIKVNTNNPEIILITLLPAGLRRIDELQKNQSNSKNVFVAMSFAGDMKNVREAIRKAILDAGYRPIIMDEIEHNKQIVPEMLYEIRQSKFVVAEFTGHNNGAYYEAGYAAGLGKEVIHICKKDSFDKGIHFDVKQVNTIIWETEAELTKMLLKRIEAVIG
jgi:nucleoside 2-deoxyribosyltransferase